MTARRVLRAPAAVARGGRVRLRTRGWPDRSRLFVLGDMLGWALDDEAAYVSEVARLAGYRLAPPAWARFSRRQVVFHTSHFAALDPLWTGSSHRLGLAYFHGLPGTPGFPEFDAAFAALRRDPGRFARVQVTHREMEEIVVSAGVDPACVHRIPIGIELERFPPGDPQRRREARDALGLPAQAFVVGSFQKDGVGFGDGLEPKWIKGPDVLVETLELARRDVDDLVVLLTGPARGYVRQELERRGIPHVHRMLPDRDGLTGAYHALDAYLVASRQEGGPKSVLESMATGVPLVTTRAGQAPDLVVDGENGILVDVEDSGGLAQGLTRIHGDAGLVARLRAAARETAVETSHERLAPRWESLLDGFAERSDG
ncbi:MAG TPA: glycosyltransferase family 4 protein [Gaiella sp.]|uniref:glycosyltransferase family 4 protein n=1 Tax=Gaiella sp. TaxID=2663207 RepID=UPI002D802BDC|nr:glycosyltransferase family 4 protein [Gaiella sp.]HET9289202.1 glycosyltransferase family 4 protein [Gaiella sp.]